MHKEVLTNKGLEIFPYLKNFSSYYLAGGTSLALQIGHRVSVDFDFFSFEKIPQNTLSTIKKIFKKDFSIVPAVNNSEEVTVFINDVKLTFLSYPFPLIYSLNKINEISLVNIKEIAAMKAYTIGRRGEYKDYIDLYFLLSEKHVTLQEIIDIASKKFTSDFNSRLFLEQLVYLDDISSTEINLLKDKSLTKVEILKTLESHIKALLG